MKVVASVIFILSTITVVAQQPPDSISQQQSITIPICRKPSASSLKKRQPLYVLNGTAIGRRKIKRIDPDRITSIKILKGKEAIEQYGEKGKNGVILLTSEKEPKKIRQSDI
jgi:hypothetical protein